MFGLEFHFELTTLWYAFEWLLRVGALFIVPRNRRPSSGTAWLLLIFLAPVPGFILFGIIGYNKLPQSRREVQQRLDAYIEQFYATIQKNADPAIKRSITNVAVPHKYKMLAELSEGLTHLPVFDGNAVEPITDYDSITARIAADIDAAKYFVYVEYYILIADEATESLFVAMESAVQRGVIVRVLYDDYGPRKYPGFKPMRRRLKAIGAHSHAMLPLRLPGRGYVRPDLRNHRKLVIIDGSIGYTGSHNMIARGYHRKDDLIYDELVVRIQGQVVRQLQAIFMTDWYAETTVLLDDPRPTSDEYIAALPAGGSIKAQLLPSGPGYEDENNLKLFSALMYTAADQITIVNPYFVPDEPLMTALVSAARRGVKVTLINSQVKDQWMVAHAQRSYYQQLFAAGVTIYLYKQPVLLHSKFIVVDSEITLVGSSNLDSRSFELDLELTLTAYDAPFAVQMQSIADDYIKRSFKLDAKQWEKRRPINQLLDNIARLTSSLQ